MSTNKSVLIIGATGALGLQCLRHFDHDASISHVHILCRNPSKLSASDKQLCDSIVTGDARDASDVENALARSEADYVVLCTGNGANVGKSDTREKTGEALAQVLQSNPAFNHVKAVVVSSLGAGNSRIKVGMGIGTMISYHLRHVLADHTRQEAAFANLTDRTLIVRPTSLTDDKGGKALVEFDGSSTKGPSISADRSDVAAWITKEIAKNDTPFRGGQVCLTSSK